MNLTHPPSCPRAGNFPRIQNSRSGIRGLRRPCPSRFGEFVRSLFASRSLRREEIVRERCRPKILVRPPPRPRPRPNFSPPGGASDDKKTIVPPFFSISIIFPFVHLLLNPADHFFPPREQANRHVKQEEPLSETAPDTCRGAVLRFPDRVGHRRTRKSQRRRRRRR